MENLIQITAEEFDLILDLRYASDNNVCHQKLYGQPFCYLHPDMIEPLKNAINLAKSLHLKLKIFDAFRPIEVQKFMFNKFPATNGNVGFVSNPENGAIPHCRGVAIDLTLVDKNGNELDMGSDFDEFSEIAFHGCQTVSMDAQMNRLTLLGLMTAAGFDFYAKEWWHYQIFKPREYPVAKTQDDSLAIE